MNFSSFKLGVYDFLGLVVPGVFLISEGCIAARGWAQFVESLSHLGPIVFTALVAAAFVTGHFIQEVADWGIKQICGDRFFKKGRDDAWVGDEGQSVRSAIWSDSGFSLGDVDLAFNYCLTRVGDAFSKRDVFVAISDFSRSFLVLIICAVLPACRLAHDQAHSVGTFMLLFGAYVLLLVIVWLLAWRRMVRFRYLSDRGVFGIYLGSLPPKKAPANGSDA